MNTLTIEKTSWQIWLQRNRLIFQSKIAHAIGTITSIKQIMYDLWNIQNVHQNGKDAAGYVIRNSHGIIPTGFCSVL